MVAGNLKGGVEPYPTKSTVCFRHTGSSALELFCEDTNIKSIRLALGVSCEDIDRIRTVDKMANITQKASTLALPNVYNEGCKLSWMQRC
jgi:hypothetical protein